MNRKIGLMVTCCYLLLSVSTTAQLLPDSVMNRYNAVRPQEKLFIHFDNDHYLPGQTVFYKIYLQSTLAGAGTSKNIYVDWYDEDGKIITRHSAPLFRSASWGSFLLPDNYTGNRLFAVAYTQWMLNFDSSLCFRKEIAIVQPAGKQSRSRGSAATETSLRFFPEGGELIEGLNSVLAFKALGPDGKPAAVQGVIRNREGRDVMPFATTHNGMGKIGFTPEAGEVYSADWLDAAGNHFKTGLPAVKRSGVVLTVKEGSLDKLFTISWTNDLSASIQKFNIVAHSNQKVLFRAVAETRGKKMINGSVPLGSFPSGVTTLTILNDAGQPLAERIFFVNNEEYQTEVSLQFDSLGLQKREKNIVTIDVPDSMSTSLSLAITAGDLPADSSENIISSLLLSSEIKGHIHNPAYYFSSDADSVKQQLDLVMLTNGWRRFNWEDAVTSNFKSLKYPKEEEYLSLTGTIKQTNGSGLLKKTKTVNLIFQAKDSSQFYALAPVNDESWFEYKNLPMFDTVKVFYQLNGTVLKGVTKITAATNLLSFDKEDRLPLWLQAAARNDNLEKIVNDPSQYMNPGIPGTTLQEVTVRTKAKNQTKTRLDELNENYTSGFFKNGDAIQLDLTDNENIKVSTNLFSYLQSKVAGLRVKYDGGNVFLNWRGPNSFSDPMNSGQVAVLVNEMQVQPAQLMDMNMTDIAYIKVFRPPFLGVPLGNGGSGAIAIYTKKIGDRSSDIMGIDWFLMQGYTPIKDFYSPDYAEQRQAYSNADLRRTLYWKPDIATDGFANKIRIAFYNNDISHSFRIVLQGISDDGKLVHLTKQIQ